MQNVEPLNQVFRRVFVLVGLRMEQFPTKEETQVLIDFCRKRLGNYTAEEILIAFEMAITGDFKADTDHFGQFTAKYLTGVLNAYNEYRNRIAKEVEEERCKQRKIETEAEEQKAVRDFFNEAVTLYNESTDNFKGSKYHANVLYDELKQHFSREELIEFKKQAKQELEFELEERRKEQNPIKRYQKQLSYDKGEWRRRTALITVNAAISKRITIDHRKV